MSENDHTRSENLVIVVSASGLLGIFALLLYVAGYNDALKGQTLDQVGMWGIIFGSIGAGLLCVALGIRLAGK